MSPTIRPKYKYFHSSVQRAKDRPQNFHFCRLPFDVRPGNVKLNLSINRIQRKINLRQAVAYLLENETTSIRFFA